MADELTFKLKVLKGLYGMGLKNFGPTLLTELKKGGPEWTLFVQTLLQGEDWASRKVALQQLTSKGFLEKNKDRERYLQMIYAILQKGLGEEKRVALKFVDQNLALFPREDDAFRSKILALQREKDPQLSAAADALLPKLGINMNDRELYRRG